MSKFKVGDKVRVVGNRQMGCWSIGHEGYILELNQLDCRVSDAIGGDDEASWYRYEDLELVKYDWDTTNKITLPPKQDNVNHPSHYGQGTIEAIDYIEDFLTEEEYIGYLRGNIGKYLHRWRYKNGLEDLLKAQWYLNKLIGVMKDET